MVAYGINKVMKIKQTIVSLMMLLGIVAVPIIIATTPASAECVDVNKCCGGANTAIITCTQNNQGSNAKDNAIWGVLVIVLNILTGGVGIAAVGGIVFASILYSSAAEDAAQVKQAKDLIQNIVIGLVAYGLMYIGLNFIIPGGIFT